MKNICVIFSDIFQDFLSFYQN